MLRFESPTYHQAGYFIVLFHYIEKQNHISNINPFKTYYYYEISIYNYLRYLFVSCETALCKELFILTMFLIVLLR